MKWGAMRFGQAFLMLGYSSAFEDAAGATLNPLALQRCFHPTEISSYTQSHIHRVQAVVSAQSGELVPLTATLKNNRPDYRFAILYGLPDNFRLTAGLRTGKTWILSAADVDDLKISVPERSQGALSLHILFFQDVGKAPVSREILDFRITPREIGSLPESPVASISPTQILPLPEILDRAPKISIIPPEKEKPLLARAEQLRLEGDIAGARLMYEKLAELGSEKGAMFMAQSFDPVFLKANAPTLSIRPNPEKAKMWYEKAKILGELAKQK